MTLSVRLYGAFALCAAVAACSPPPTAPTAAVPRDTGNMAYPAPLPAGNVNTVRPR